VCALFIYCGELFKNNDSATQTQREFRKHFNIGRKDKVSTSQTLLNWVIQFRSTASALRKKNPGRPRSVHNPENLERVRVALQQSPRRSARRHSVALGM
jgi:transposase